MPDTMTRVQAICACRNIARLAEEITRAPEDFREGLQERAASMEERLIANTRYPRVTEKMDAALRNMWQGLKRWDRDSEYADDLFEDLEEVEGEIADLDASGENKPPPKGREGNDEAAKARAAKLAAAGIGVTTGRIPCDKPNEANKPKRLPEDSFAKDVEDAVTKPPAYAIRGPGSVFLADILRRKEEAIGFVLAQIFEAPITVVNKKTLRNLAVADVLAMTKSDRNQQLIRAAYYIGVLRGIGLLHGKIQEDDG